MLADSRTCSLPPGLTRLVGVWTVFESTRKGGSLAQLVDSPGCRLLKDSTTALVLYLNELVKVCLCAGVCACDDSAFLHVSIPPNSSVTAAEVRSRGVVAVSVLSAGSRRALGQLHRGAGR